MSCVRGPASDGPAPATRRESAYRANNRGVALLEQQRPEPAVQAFRDALAAYPALRIATLNLPIAL